MATGTDERVVQVRDFKGLNIKVSSVAIEDAELSEVVNYNLGDGGELVKRTGWKEMWELGSPFKLLGFFQTSTLQVFIIAFWNGSLWHIYSSPNGTAWTAIATVTGTPQYGVQYVDKFYIIQTGGTAGLVEVNSTATGLAEITGSPAGTFCKVFKDRLFVVNSGSSTVASRLYYSKPFDFSATGWPATNFIDVGSGDGDWLTAVWNLQDTLVVFKSGASWNLYVQGDPTLWILRPFYSEIGCFSKHTLSVVENLLYFVGVNGAYVTDGNSIRNISLKIAPAFKAVVVSQTTIDRASAFVWEDKFVISLETFPVVTTWNAWSTKRWNELATTTWTGGNAEITYLVYHVRQKGWTKWEIEGDITPFMFVPVIFSATLKGVYCNDRTNTRLYKFGEEMFQDDNVDYEVAVETKDFDFGLTTEMKRGKWVGITQRGAGTHTITHIIEGETKSSHSVVLVVENTELKVPGPGYFRSWRIRASATHSNPLTLFGFTIHLHRRRQLAGIK